MTLLRGENVTKSFGGLVAVDGVDFEIQPGEIVGLIGPNGSGKTTLFNCVTGALEMDSGRVVFDGEDVSDAPEYAIAQAGLVRLFQEVRTYEEMTLAENLLVSVDHGEETTADVFRRYPDEVHDRARELLEFVDLWELRDREAGELSYGQRKLLEFAMTLMPDPDLLLLDEPASGINPTMVEHLIAYIRAVNEEREKTLFVIEHNIDMIMAISDRLYVMSSGDVIAEGEPEEIRNSQRVQEAYLGGGR